MPGRCRNRITAIAQARKVFAVLLSLWFSPVIEAVPNFSPPGFEFIPADPARVAEGYMDSGGTWNGNAEVTNSTGDTLRVTLSNSAAGAPDPLVDDVAFDIALSIDVPAGFRLPSNPFNVTTTASGGDPVALNCVAPGGGTVTATQLGGVGTPIIINIPADTNQPAQGTGPACTYTFALGITTSSAAPFVAAGNYSLDYSFSYNEVNDDPASQQTISGQQDLEIRSSDIILVKNAIPNPPDGYKSGDTTRWQIDITNNGNGGAFEVDFTDIPNANLSNVRIDPVDGNPLTPPPPVAGTSYTCDYIQPGNFCRFWVYADVQVPAAAQSCPELRNDSSAVDRLGNTSSSFDVATLDLDDPLLDYTPTPVTFDFGNTTTISFNINNPGPVGIDGGPAKNIVLTVAGLAGLTITNVDPGWSFNGTDTFTWLDPNSLPNGGSIPFSFDISMDSCGGPAGGTLTWTLSYENICGTDFIPQVRNSTFTVNNIPALGVNKTATPLASNFGRPANYTIDLTGTQVTSLPANDAIDNDNDWTVTDTLPAGVANGLIALIPTGTSLSVGAVNYNGGDTNIPVTAGDIITWRGDVQDLTPLLPSITIDFTLACTGVPPGPPVLIANGAALAFPNVACPINAADGAAILVNESPIDSDAANITVSGGGPFETGRADSNGTNADEGGEGEHFTYTASYQFPLTNPGVWSGSSFRASMGNGGPAPLPSAAAGFPLQLTRAAGGVNSSVTVTVNNPGGPDYGPTSLPFASLQINPDGSFEIPDLNFVVADVGPNMAGMELIISYTVTAPQGILDGSNNPLNGNEINVGAFTERVTINVANNPFSCSGDEEFTHGVDVDLIRADIAIAAAINAGGDVDVCDIATADILLTGPAAGLRADNIRIFIDSNGNYTLPNNPVDFTYDGAGNLGAIVNAGSYDYTGGNVQITVAPNTTNITGDNTISFPVQLLDTTSRQLTGYIQFDSAHTSPDAGISEDDRDYTVPFNIDPPAVNADLAIDFFPPNLVLRDNAVYIWRVRITNVGTSTVNNAVFTYEIPAPFIPEPASTSPAPDSTVGQVMTWSMNSNPGFNPLAPSQSFEVDVAMRLNRGGGCNIGTPAHATVLFGCDTGTILEEDDGPGVQFPVIDLDLDHRSGSYCELCNDSYVDLRVRNSGGSDLYDISVVENLAGSGLEYAGRTDVFPEGAAMYTIAADPNLDGATTLNWDPVSIPQLGHVYSDLSGSLPTELTIRFYVRSSDANPENLVSASRQIQATADYLLYCGDTDDPVTLGDESEVSTPPYIVPLYQPQPDVDKQGRNYSARQSAANYTDPVYGGTDDIIVWRVDVANSGAANSADLEDLLVNDTITPGVNFTLQYICPTETAANAQALTIEGGGSAAVAPCVAYATPHDIDDPFGNPGNDEPGANIDAQRGSSAFTYYVGTVADLCTNETNNSSIEWGCQVNAPAGGINADGSGGALDAGLPADSDDDTAGLSTGVNPFGVDIARSFTGINPAQPVGTKGVLTITVTNNSGGTIRDLVLTDTLPEDYQIDLTSLNAPNTPLVINPAYGTYPGIVDEYALDATDPNEPIFTFTSSTQGTIYQRNLLRNGDQLILTIGVIRVTPFDDDNNPEVRTENTGDGTDPNYSTANTTNTISLSFDDTCISNPPLAGVPRINTLNVNIDPEDLDININPADPDLFFILSDPAATLNLDVVLTNNGGHDATDFDTYVTIGLGIDPMTVPANCSVVAPPAELGTAPLNPGGIMPPQYDSAESTTYRCINNDPIAPAGSDTFAFVVQRALDVGGNPVSGDLTFRADVLARSTLSDGTAPPNVGAAGYPYYSKDNILARIIGFNLNKNFTGNCSEGGVTPAPNVQIGEECSYQISAEWFGFATPGFGNIEIQNARIYEGARSNNPPAVEVPPSGTPNLPDTLNGQGLVSVDFTGSSTDVTVAAQVPAAPTAVQETAIAWRLNTITAPADLSSEQSFFANLVYRNLNDQVNSSAAPNVHNAARIDESNVRFDVVFTATGTRITFDENSAGYPPASVREERVYITEPNVTLNKAVCNESISIANNAANSGANCTPFIELPAMANGDSDDNYIYRITVNNEAAASGRARAPAFDITINDATDPSDQMAPFDLASDGIDNDADGLIDALDLDGEGTVDDLTLVNGNPADLTFDGSNSTALLQIDAGDSVDLFYRARLDPMVTPTQALTNTADGSYDSLAGDSGAQSQDQGVSGTLTGAREYTIPQVQSTMRVDNIVVTPGSKRIVDTSRRNAGLVAGVCASPCLDENVVIGEEVMVELEFTIPLSELRQFRVVDNLPAGIECIEALDIDLPAFNPPTVDPGFTPGGTFAATTCDADSVVWDLSTAGNQQLVGSGGIEQFTVQARFIARVQNTVGNDNAVVLANGGGSTQVLVEYRDVMNTLQQITMNEARLTIQEPQLVITKTMDPVAPNTSIDSADTFNVTVQINNTGSSPAYNIQLRDTLEADLSFVNGSVAGTNPPDSVDVSIPSEPLFTYNSPLPAGASYQFTFQVLADSNLRPLQELSNTIDARFTSLPANTIALNAGGTIGLDGDADGMRDGDIPAVAGDVNDYETQATDTEVVSPLTVIKNDLDPAVTELTIGQRKNFEVVIDLPEGNAQSVVINDDLGTGSGNFIIENDGSYDVTYRCNGIAGIRGAAIDCTDTVTATTTITAALTAANEPADEASGLVSWNFGDIQTNTEDDTLTNAITPQIVINYFARAANDATTIAGTTLQNQLVANYINGEDNITVEVINAPVLGPFNVIEPRLIVNKTGPPALGPSVPGAFTITVENQGDATAWDVTVEDVMPNLAPNPGGMCDTDPTTVTPAPLVQIISPGNPNRVLVAGQDYVINYLPEPACNLTVVLTPVAGGDEDGRLEAGEILRIDYTTTLDSDTLFGINLTNVAGATQWFSQDTDGVTAPVETRDYRDFPVVNDKQLTNGTVGIDDHQDAHTLTSELSLSVVKSVAEATAAPGQTLNYTITVANSYAVPLTGMRVLDDLDAINTLNFAGGYFQAGSLSNILINGAPAGVNDFSDLNGGVAGTGLLDLRNLTIPVGGNLVITFSIDLRGPDAPLPKAYVENRASVNLGVGSVVSNIVTTEIVDIAAGFLVEKTSTDLSGAADVLVSGDTLRYTITIKNTGTFDPAMGITHAVNTLFNDQVPANTSYVAGSTTVNGVAVADITQGVAPFTDGMLINSPDVSIPGFMTANPDLGDNSNAATVTFDVTINNDLIDGTIISNQSYITGTEQAVTPFTPVPFTPAVSDDPETPVADDPTQDVVGSGSIIDVQKTVTDVNGGTADPGDILLYTITVTNNGNAVATGANLTDQIPVNTSYVAGTTRLNTIVQADVAGVSPLVSGLQINSDSVLPANGELRPDEIATIEFQVTINAVANGTVISNQSLLTGNEFPDEPSDNDGNDENGDQPTVIIVGGSDARLEVTKEVIVVGGGTVQLNGQLEYLIRVTNIGTSPANNVVVTDVMPPELSYIAGSAQLNGTANPAQVDIQFTGNTLTVNYGNSLIYGPLDPADSFLITFRATVSGPFTAIDNTISNEAALNWTGCAPIPGRSDCAFDNANVDLGGAPGVANISGRVWNNLLHDDVYDAVTETAMPGWQVRLFINNNAPTSADTPLATATTDDQGLYNFNGLAPVDPTALNGAYTIIFSAPSAPEEFPAGSNIGLGDTLTQVGNSGLMITTNISSRAGSNANNESLPIDPTGVIYNSVTRQPLQDALVELRSSDGTLLPAGCFVTPAHLDNQQGQITSRYGFYRFDLNFSNAECPASATDYIISVSLLNDDQVYVRTGSTVIPAEVGAINVATCPDSSDDRVPSPPPNTCEIQEQGMQPDPYVLPGNDTRYFLDVRLQQATAAELFNNHIPIDIDVGALVSISKQTPLKNVVRGQLVPYTIVVTNSQNFPLSSVEIRDFFPPGFKYVQGSADIDGVSRDPEMDASTFAQEDLRAGTLTWNNLILNPQSTLKLRLLLVVGSGVKEGEYTNQAQVFITGLATSISQRASATVRVVPDPTFDCSDIIGKVFDDRNANGYPDAGEPGIAGSRVVTAQGLLTTTDQYGRFHITCAAVPNMDRGSNFILKLDERTLPSGYRVTTENPRVQRLTRGKAIKFNFGATVHRVVRLDLADAAFEPGSAEIREHWRYVIDELFDQLQQKPSVLRIAYVGDAESEKLAEQRTKAVKRMIEDRWHKMNCCYNLTIETEMFWRRGQALQ
ncbi:MAG: DUF11 domain-containing protein [Gammaproteobacteria bacterium]|nr:DUF11 domain-containing protein [Gammaproteobacteria bacterium]